MMGYTNCPTCNGEAIYRFTGPPICTDFNCESNLYTQIEDCPQCHDEGSLLVRQDSTICLHPYCPSNVSGLEFKNKGVTVTGKLPETREIIYRDLKKAGAYIQENVSKTFRYQILIIGDKPGKTKLNQCKNCNYPVEIFDLDLTRAILKKKIGKLTW